MRIEFFRRGLRLALLAVIATSNTAHAERMPDPIEVIAELTAFAELCAEKYPELGDMPARLFDDGASSDRPRILALRASPALEPALAKARVDVLRLSEEKVQVECRTLAGVPLHR